MRRIKLLFGVHNHQPLGNFNDVFEHAYEKSYRPFIETVGDYPDFRITYHFSGPLLLFLQDYHPEITDTIKHQVERKQAEVVVSGFYEPILAMIPNTYRILQINLAKDYVKQCFGADPVGLWLTERVFESEILPALKKTGIKYFVVDDTAFTQIGISRENLFGYFLHPVDNDFIAVFPIDETLRYLIPFKPVDEVLSYFKQVHESGGNALIFFDDGEKFGLWVGTHDWVFGRRWLRNFIESCLKADFIETQRFSDYLNENDHLGVIFLPSSSYFEMGEWSLHPDSAYRYIKILQRLKNTGIWDELQPFFRGGIWRNFLCKYKESGKMYRRMLWLSNELNKGNQDTESLDPLLRAQCNDPYWHGVFGGIYLPHLRHETYKNLLLATETILKTKESNSITVLDFDFNMDGKPDLAFFSESWSFIVDPYKGTLLELSYMPIKYNFQNTLTKYREHYHRYWENTPHHTEQRKSGVPSIHELTKQIPEDVRKEMHFDTYSRESFIDRVLPKKMGLDSLKSCGFNDSLSHSKTTFSIISSRNHHLRMHTILNDKPFSIEKLFRVKERGIFVVGYHVEGVLQRETAFVVELNFIMPSATEGEIVASCNRFKFNETVDLRPKLDDVIEYHDNSGTVLTIKPGPITRLVIFPYYTVSQSESGVELIYQGHSVFLFYDIRDKVLDFEVAINTKEDGNAGAQV